MHEVLSECGGTILVRAAPSKCVNFWQAASCCAATSSTAMLSYSASTAGHAGMLPCSLTCCMCLPSCVILHVSALLPGSQHRSTYLFIFDRLIILLGYAACIITGGYGTRLPS